MGSALPAVVWFLDRGTALVALPALWCATLTGVFVRTRYPARLHGFSNRWHTRLSVFALLVAGMHAVTGLLDALFLEAGLAPAPGYPNWFFLAGVVLGLLSLVATLVAVVSFLAPWRFEDPSLVHALAYVGFALGVVHAVAIGTDVVGLTERLVLASLVVVGCAVGVKFAVGVGTTLKRAVAR